MVYKRSIYTVVTPLPPTISRETAVAALHNHSRMIELNPLVINHEKCKPPPNAPADEFHCTWYQLTDRVPYFPGIKGLVNYKGCFHDLPRGVQTHVYAPAGLDIKEKWSIGGNEPGEEREILELGHSKLGIPREGLYLREDIDMRCNIFLTSFVKKTLNKAHNVLVERLVVQSDLVDDKKVRENYNNCARSSTLGGNSFRVGSPSPSHLYDRRMSVGGSSNDGSNNGISSPQSTIFEVIPDMSGVVTYAELDGGLYPPMKSPRRLQSISHVIPTELPADSPITSQPILETRNETSVVA